MSRFATVVQKTAEKSKKELIGETKISKKLTKKQNNMYYYINKGLVT